MLVLLTLATALAGTTCTSVGDGPEVVYSTYAKSGGAQPGPDTLMASQSWTIADTEVFTMSRTRDGDPKRTPDVDWAWDFTKTTPGRVTENSHTKYEVRYTTEVRLFRPSGKALLPDLAAWQGAMRCIRQELRGLPAGPRR